MSLEVPEPATPEEETSEAEKVQRMMQILQLDDNMNNSDKADEEIKEAFLEFYKLLDDYEIIKKSTYGNINAWYDIHQVIET